MHEVTVVPAGSWERVGALGLTGPADGPPLVPPDGIRDRIEALGRPIGVDAVPLLVERAALAGLARRGAVSCGGTTRLLRAADAWLAVTLARPSDHELVPAWLEAPDASGDPWVLVAEAVRGRSAAELVERATLLGLAVARVAETVSAARPPVVARQLGAGVAAGAGAGALVVDLSGLWAGPLCGRLLRERGARVVKVESTRRPDGARAGDPAFFGLLHHGSRSVALDFADPGDRARLRELLLRADVVVEASRPRALQQLGIDAAEIVAAGPSVWVSITGHGRSSNRIGFGDDTAAAGGLVAGDDAGRPHFVADAVADPLAGVAAAVAVVEAQARGGRWLLDVSMSAVAAAIAGPDAGRPWSPGPRSAPPPRPRRPLGPGPGLGEHTAEVLAELGIP